MAASSKTKKRSGNPAKNPTTAGKWKRQKGDELKLPSGNVALVKRPGPQALLSEGIMPDTLLPIVQEAITKGKGLKPKDASEMMGNPDAINEMLTAIDRLLEKVVVAPVVQYHRCRRQLTFTPGAIQDAATGGEWQDIPEDLRDGETECSHCGKVHPDAEEGAVYTDEVDLEDKMFVFQYALGGTRDLERFRSEYGAGLGDLPVGEGDADETE